MEATRVELEELHTHRELGHRFGKDQSCHQAHGCVQLTLASRNPNTVDRFAVQSP